MPTSAQVQHDLAAFTAVPSTNSTYGGGAVVRPEIPPSDKPQRGWWLMLARLSLCTRPSHEQPNQAAPSHSASSAQGWTWSCGQGQNLTLRRASIWVVRMVARLLVCRGAWGRLPWGGEPPGSHTRWL